MILNLHGLNGSSHNTTYRLLAEMYAEEMLFSPQIDYVRTSPSEIIEQLREYENMDYIVGNSFGGFFAYILSNICHIPCLLVNPCIPPERYIPSLVKGYAYTDELISLMDRYSFNPQSVYMILGMDDTVLSPSHTEKILNAAEVWKIKGGHSLSGNQQFYSTFKEAVKRILRHDFIPITD